MPLALARGAGQELDLEQEPEPSVARAQPVEQLRGAAARPQAQSPASPVRRRAQDEQCPLQALERLVQESRQFLRARLARAEPTA